MKNINNIISLLFVALVAALVTGCGVFEELKYDKVDNTPPVITSVSPESAPRYSDVTLSGTNLQKAEKILLGDQQLTIKYRISNTEMIVVVDGTLDGVFKTQATIDQEQVITPSEVNFTYLYVTPSISQLPESMEVGSPMLIRGANMMSTEHVWLVDPTDPSNPDKKVAAQIQSRNTTEVIVRVPYVTYPAGSVVLSYFDGSHNVDTVPSEESISVIVFEPTEIVVTDPAVEEGEQLEITGRYLDKVESVKIDGRQVPITSQSGTNLKVTIPASLFADGDNPALPLNLVYFDGQADRTVANVDIYVPEVIRGRNQTIVAQGRTSEYLTSFFNLNTGLAVHNSGFATLDPVALRYMGSDWAATTCTAANTIDKAKISQEDYSSVTPYFYLRSISTNGGTVQFSGPTSTQSGLRAYYTARSGNATCILGEANRTSACAGTPLVLFVPLSNAATAPQPEKDVYTAIRTGTLLKIDATTFPIDETLNTIGGISLIKADGISARTSAFVGQDDFAPGYLRGDGDVTDLAAAGEDGVVMVIYYNYADGYDPANPAKGILRVGFIHTKGFFFDVSHAAGDSRNSVATFDTYWQKYENEN